jgi:alkylhydroperoxidase family enzyme
MVEASLDEDWTDPCFDPAQKTAFRFALQYDAGHTVSDGVWEAARQQFDEAALVELALVCGHYGALARFAIGFRLDQAATV